MNSEDQKRTSLLPKISVTRPVTVTMCLIGLMVIGIVAYARIPIQAWASGDEWNWFWVDVNQDNASVQERFNTIALPLERHMRTLRDLGNIYAFSGDPWAGVQLGFKPGTDMRQAYARASDRLERAKLELPEEIRDRIKIWAWNQETDSEIVWSGLSIPDHIENKEHWVQAHILDPLERVDGVAKTSVWGLGNKEVMILVDQERLRSHNIDTHVLVAALRQDNFALSGGQLSEGGKRYLVRSLAHYRSLEEIENVPIQGAGVEQEIRLKDVADVVLGAEARKRVWRVDGKTNLAVDVYKESGQNIVDLCQRVVDKMDEIEATTDADFHVFYSEGKLIEDSMNNLKETGLWGGLFAALVLLFFLRAVRMTALITLSIPLCVMMTVTVLYFVGWSLNLLTMMGLMVGVGMVVDNAIVIVENIYRLRAQGENPHDAAIHGASEVGLAITMATLTTVVVFVPMMLMNESHFMKFLLSKIGLPVVFALVASLFVALIFIPLAAKRFGDETVRPDPKSIGWLRNAYKKGLAWTVHHRRDTLLIVVLLFATIWWPVNHIKKTDRMRFSSNRVTIRLWGPRNLSMEEMDEIARDLEAFVDARRERYKVSNVMTFFRPGFLDVRLSLKENPNQDWWYPTYEWMQKTVGMETEPWITRKEIIDALNKDVPRYVGFRVAVEARNSGGNDPNIRVYLYGDDFEKLENLMEEVERRLSGIPSVTELESELEFGNEEVRIRIDRDKAKRHGITGETVSQTLAYQLRGAQLPRFQMDDRELNVHLLLDESDRQSLMQLKNYTFTTDTGEKLPLSSFATFEITKGPRNITRHNGRNRLRIRVFTTKEDMEGLYTDIDKAMEGFELPRGYEWNKGERYTQYSRESEAMKFAIIMAITFVFLLMGILFESVILPFAVILSIPFSFLGVYWGLYVTNTTMDFMSQVGSIVLIGVVVNNAIVLVDMINRLRLSGMDRTEAILEAGFNRFRPILMTTCTTVFGLLPMAIGSSTMMGMPYAPLGITMMGGLLVSTLLTLFVIPLFYMFLDDLSVSLKRMTLVAFRRSDGVVDDQAQAAD
ncbi:MAG: HAE1 family hydrophobic/amphiphilic exporter-1 [Candidatus Latescibacterota bacterium]|jgi:HAE1 family hydrophobic/amphiphilic exporter-1